MKKAIILIAICILLGYFFYIYGHGWESIGLGCILASLVGIIVCICELIKRKKEK